MGRSILANFPTEKLVFHKLLGSSYEVEGMFSSSDKIMTEDVSIPIETDDYFERRLPNGIIEYYKVIDAGYHRGVSGIPDHYQTKVESIKEPPNIEKKEKKKLIFLSHSSSDKEYTKAFVNLLFDIGLDDENIVCSSYPGVGVPLREKVYDWLVERFQEYDLHVIYFLSHNYYKSAASLNEMGAAWAMKQKWDGLLLPGFSFSDISGCIDSTQISIKLDGDVDELKHRLGELKDDIINEFGLKQIGSTRWERIRGSFITAIQEVIPEKNETTIDYVPVSLAENDDTLTEFACVMLLYASEGDGQILVSQALDGASYQAGRTTLERSRSHRELSLWDDAIARLIKKGYIKKVGRKEPIFQVTAMGYAIADGFKVDNELNTNKSPAEILKEFGL